MRLLLIEGPAPEISRVERLTSSTPVRKVVTLPRKQIYEDLVEPIKGSGVYSAASEETADHWRITAKAS
jgi:hypothetical protein